MKILVKQELNVTFYLEETSDTVYLNDAIQMSRRRCAFREGAASASCGCVFVEVETITLKHQTQLAEDHKQPKAEKLSYSYTGSRSNEFRFIFWQFHNLALLNTMWRR